MNEIQCLAVAVILFKRILERVRDRGYLTVEEKSQIFATIQILTRRVFHELGQVGELLGQLEMPRIQHRYLEEKCADAYDE
jgi:hypothetical protein